MEQCYYYIDQMNSINNMSETDFIQFNNLNDESSFNSISSSSINKLIFSQYNGAHILLNESIKIGEDSSPLGDKNKGNEKEYNNKDSTLESSNKKNRKMEMVKSHENLNHKEEIKNEKKPIFQEKDITSNKTFDWRFDYGKKYWKVKISQDLTECINQSIKNSDLPKNLKKTISKPDSLLFTSNVNESDNCYFLEQDLKTILTFGKGETRKISNNYDKISKIYKFFKKIGYNNLSDKMLEIKNLFEMKYEDFIKKFYESEEFENFKNEENTIFYDEGTKKKEGFRIYENYGLIRILGEKEKEIIR